MLFFISGRLLVNDVTVRPVREDDLDALALLEQDVWATLGAPVLSRDDLEEWFLERSPFFLVAETDGSVCGYYFGRQIEFTLADQARYTCAGASVNGQVPCEPAPGADSAYGICVVARKQGAGLRLKAEVRKLLDARQTRYFIGLTRLSRLDRFMRALEATQEDPLSASREEIALWYALESATLLGMKTWDQCPAKPSLALSRLTQPDPVLGFHVRETTFGLLGIVPDYMPDPASRNFGAFIVSEYPHART